jgi:septum site-determining protein MinC
MTKIAIISQPEQSLLIDISGCSTYTEASHHLSSTLESSNQFCENKHVDLNLGDLVLDNNEVAQILSIISEAGIEPRQVFVQKNETKDILQKLGIAIASGEPAKLLSLETSAAESKNTKDVLVIADKNSDDAPNLLANQPVLYLRQTLRSGQAVSHGGHLVIIGDVNPGAEIMAKGDIIVWGALRGMAHAGVDGNIDAHISALKLAPIQLRIAHAIARAPDRSAGFSANAGPETARIVDGKIRIVSSAPE